MRLGPGPAVSAELVRDTIAAALVAGANTTITPNDGADTITIASSGVSLGLSYPFTRTYTADQHDGVFAWLGTRGGTCPFYNPALGPVQVGYILPDLLGIPAASVVTSQINDLSAGLGAANATDHMTSSNYEAHTQNTANAWWKADFKAGHTITPTYVSLAGRADASHHPRNWKIQGSNDDSAWTDLLTVAGAGSSSNTRYAAPITGSAAYRYLRLLETGLNSSSASYLVIGDIEFWGTLT